MTLKLRGSGLFLRLRVGEAIFILNEILRFLTINRIISISRR